jgi:hypothetical protein
MEANLATTNLLLGIMAAVGVLEVLVMIGMGVAGYLVYRRVSDLLTKVETRHLAPAMLRVNTILDDVRDVTARVREETERVDHAINSTMDRVEDTADRVRSSVRARTSRIVGFVRGLRAAIDGVLRTRARRQPPAGEAGRA